MFNIRNGCCPTLCATVPIGCIGGRVSVRKCCDDAAVGVPTFSLFIFTGDECQCVFKLVDYAIRGKLLYNRFNAIIEVAALSDEAITRMLTARVPECSPVVYKLLGV